MAGSVHWTFFPTWSFFPSYFPLYDHAVELDERS